MTRIRTLTIISGLLALGSVFWAAAAQEVRDAGDNVVLITLDGARTEEIFGGLQLDILKSTMREKQVVEDSPAYRRFWAATPEERRLKLMPFFWSLVTREGSIAGNRRLGSSGSTHERPLVLVSGLFRDPARRGARRRDQEQRPDSQSLHHGARDVTRPVAAASRESGDVCQLVGLQRDCRARSRQDLRQCRRRAAWPCWRGDVRPSTRFNRQAVTPWDNTRSDAFTFHLAMAHLAAARPRVLYLAFDETDDWAHDGRYERVLDAFARTDGYLKELWTLAAERSRLSRPHPLADHDRSRPRPHAGRLARPRRENRRRAGVVDRLCLAEDDAPRRVEGPEPLATNQIAATIELDGRRLERGAPRTPASRSASRN